ncbi:mycothiol system anti-sigma-R factor [Dermatobacter hominis]|uniref:mycothiol system anti-sigma-R factor n=1 Tax=Dermatobacter hominis TaxID=2884263 RepID=UPI001D101961|nr:mycothiol system anti-sigma-R factor [Dermatobacter hominis]UDY34438.1 mycothiol system anti-sigma-R factor [Dermatobacter hominis]
MSSTPAPSSSGEPDLPDVASDAAHAGHDHERHDHERVTDCDEAVAELYAFLDGELDAAVLVQVETHLRRCSPCLEAFDFEADLRRVIAAKCTEQVPPDIKARFCGMLRELGSSDGATDDPGAGVPAPADGS